MKPTKDFLKVMLCAHVVATAKQCLKEDNSVDDCVVVARKIVEKLYTSAIQLNQLFLLAMTESLNIPGTSSPCP